MLVSILFGVVAVVPTKPRGWVVGSAIVIGAVAFLWLITAVAVPAIYDWGKRRGLRKDHELQKLTVAEQEKSPSQISRHAWFGFEVIYSTDGLKEVDPDPNTWARLKRGRGGSQYIAYAFPLEVHRYQRRTYIVGYATSADISVLERGANGQIDLWMRPVWRAHAKEVVEVPLARIDRDGSRGLGTWKSPWRLELTLKSE